MRAGEGSGREDGVFFLPSKPISSSLLGRKRLRSELAKVSYKGCNNLLETKGNCLFCSHHTHDNRHMGQYRGQTPMHCVIVDGCHAQSVGCTSTPGICTRVRSLSAPLESLRLTLLCSVRTQQQRGYFYLRASVRSLH